MSEDRFKRARRSLVGQGARPQGFVGDSFDEGAEDEATALVQMDEVLAQAEPEEFEDEATQLVDMSGHNARPSPPPRPPARPPQRPPAARAPQRQSWGPMHSGFHKRPEPARAQDAPPLFVGTASGSEAHTQFVDLETESGFDPGGARGRESTQSIALDDLIEGAPSVMLDPSQAGYKGSTQFVDLDELSSSSGSALAPDEDLELQATYEIGQDAVQTFGEVVLIFARDQAGRDVVLKRVWSGAPQALPPETRARLVELGQIVHPNIAAVRGLFTGLSGAWAELERPAGVRLSYLLARGAQPRTVVAAWAESVALGLREIHKRGLVYGVLVPDAIWVDELSGEAKLEPFDIAAFEERDPRGPYAPPEGLTGSSADETWAVAAIVLAALTGSPSQGALAMVEPAKLQRALARALHPDRGERETSLAPLMSALGAKKAARGAGFDRRMLVPIGVLSAILVGLIAWDFFAPAAPLPPPRQVNAVEPPPPDRVPKADAPGVIDPVEGVTVLTSYEWAPPEDELGRTTEPVDQEEQAERARRALAALKKSARKQSADRRTALEAYASAVRRAPETELGEFDRAIAESDRLRADLDRLASEVESRLKEGTAAGAVALPYRPLSRANPHADAARFFDRNARAKVRALGEPAASATIKDEADKKEAEQ